MLGIVILAWPFFAFSYAPNAWWVWKVLAFGISYFVFNLISDDWDDLVTPWYTPFAHLLYPLITLNVIRPGTSVWFQILAVALGVVVMYSHF